MEISTKSTKAEVMEAYEELKKKLENLSTAKPVDEKLQKAIKAEENKVVEQASTYTTEKIVKDLADLNLYTGKALNELSEKLTGEAAKLNEIQNAIEIEKRYLEEVRDIKIAADSLSLLIQEYDSKKKASEQEMLEKEINFKQTMEQMQEEWKKEQKSHESSVKERDTITAKERTREKEEYDYNLALARKKDKDAYEQQKTALLRDLKEEKEKQEKEFAERETILSERETELNDLRKKVDSFDALLKDALDKAEKDAVARTEQKAQVTSQLFAKEKEGEIKLLELKNKNLQEQVEKQILQIEALTNQLADANNQVLSIATKAIEGASGAKTLSTVQEIAMEQARQPKTPK